MVATVTLGDVDRELIALALSRLADALAHEVAAGRARQQPIRSPEYERALQWICGGGEFGKGMLARLGTEATDLKPRWEPIVLQPCGTCGGEGTVDISQTQSRRCVDCQGKGAVPKHEAAGGGAATGETRSTP